jgi:hypothetical protein
MIGGFLDQQPRPKGTGYVVLIRYLYSGFNTFINRHKWRGIKPLNTNKKTIFKEVNYGGSMQGMPVL